MEKDNEALVKDALDLPPVQVGRGRRVAEIGLLSLLGVSVATLGLGLVAYVFSEVAALGLLIFGGGGWLFHRLFLRADAEDRLVALRAQLHAHLVACGIAAEDTSEAAQRERAAFWQQAQTSALLELRERRDKIRAASTVRPIWLATRELRRLYLVVSAAWAALALVLLAYGAWQDDAYVAGECIFISFLVYAAWTASALTGIGVTRTLGAYNARAALDHEIRHVAALMDAAGGLSLADEEVEAALRGALSSDVAQGGELEEIKP